MASAQASQHFLANNLITMYDFDPDSADAQDVAWVDMRDYREFTLVFFRTVGTSALDTFNIIANADSAGGGSDVIIKTYSGDAPNAAGDTAYLSCTAEEIADLGRQNSLDLRYVSASLEFATNTDEAFVTYIRSQPRFGYLDQTANAIS